MLGIELQEAGQHRLLFFRWWGFHLAGWLLVQAISSLLSRRPAWAGPFKNNFFLQMLLLGAVLGTMYWFILRPTFQITFWRWPLALSISFLGGTLTWAATLLQDMYQILQPGPVTGAVVFEWDPLFGGALLGLVLGLGICWAWRLPSRLTLVFVLANLLGWSLGLFLGQLPLIFIDAYPQPGSPAFLLQLILEGGISGLLSGIGLLWIARDVP